ncbi:uncharacterized protein LOC141614427 [Silene latifolia]|uniref:uncharacterized protein LOC141614427 n=1 Tax=Silene latifolia TaxID=37657 RepID=UPI003D788D75
MGRPKRMLLAPLQSEASTSVGMGGILTRQPKKPRTRHPVMPIRRVPTATIGQPLSRIPNNEYPSELARLYTASTEDAEHFRKYARAYNNLFAFSSIGGEFDAETQKGIYVFKLHGQIYHHVPNLLPTDGKTQTNPYSRFFRSLKEISVDENTQILINKNPRGDPNVYNAPSSDEVAVILSDSSSSSLSEGPHISVTGKENDSHRIMHYYGYPLLFPSDSVEAILEAEETLTSLAPDEDERQISCREYYCYKLQNRPGNMLLKAGRCLQQYIVDMYVKVENTRLDFFRRNQDTIHAELYQGILDAVDAGERCAANVGRRVILPPTYIGGPRDLKRRYLNAMSLVQEYGKPDLFITMTCNSNWPEIKDQLAPGEEAHSRPDIVVRVFHAKLLALRKLIMEKHIFGEVAAFIYVVEFQKRGLPHAHILIILKPPYKLNSPSDFYKFVSAEIPCSDSPRLRALVLKHMMHEPCGKFNPDYQCMKKKNSMGRCKYNYPKSFTCETTTNSDGYPEYKRRDDGQTTVVRKATLNNRWVIPYSPYLLSLFDCHLNMEVCSTIEAVKYLYKYVYKGHDKISFNFVRGGDPKPVDEIEQC